MNRDDHASIEDITALIGCALALLCIVGGVLVLILGVVALVVR